MCTYTDITDQEDLQHGDVICAGYCYWYREEYHDTMVTYRFRQDPVPFKGAWRGHCRWCKGFRIQRWRHANYPIEDDLTELLPPQNVEKIRRSSPNVKNGRYRDYWDELPRNGCKDRSWKFCTKRQRQYKNN